jgi:hypothetical protein
MMGGGVPPRGGGRRPPPAETRPEVVSEYDVDTYIWLSSLTHHVTTGVHHHFGSGLARGTDPVMTGGGDVHER